MLGHEDKDSTAFLFSHAVDVMACSCCIECNASFVLELIHVKAIREEKHALHGMQQLQAMTSTACDFAQPQKMQQYHPTDSLRLVHLLRHAQRVHTAGTVNTKQKGITVWHA